MKNERKIRLMYLSFAFVWSYVFWGISIFLASQNTNPMMMENHDIVMTIFSGGMRSGLGITNIFNIIAGYGPLLAAMFMFFAMPESRDHFRERFHLRAHFKYLIIVLGVFVLIAAIAIVPMMQGGRMMAASIPMNIAVFIFMFFVYQFLTASTEEVGWRGLLLPSYMKTCRPAVASLFVGVIRALWYAPLAVTLLITQRLSTQQMIPALLTMTVGIIAMSFIYTHYYMKTKNVFFTMVINVIASSLPILALTLTQGTYSSMGIVHALTTVFAIVLVIVNRKEFFAKPEAA